MRKSDLGGTWQMREMGGLEWIPAQVPGTVYNDLLTAGKTEDAYWRNNETKIQELFDKDYEYERNFLADSELLKCDQIVLCCEGLDTLTEIFLNEEKIAETDNMLRSWRIDVTGKLKLGKNRIRICFHTTVPMVKEIEAADPRTRGFTRVRKGACMYGWDWGLSLPDAGIWRNIYLEGIESARLANIQVLQEHTEDGVVLKLIPAVENCRNASYIVCWQITDPEGKEIAAITQEMGDEAAQAVIREPKLWWPAGQGEHPLYQVKAILKAENKVIDEETERIGLRTMVLDRTKDEAGRAFTIVVNGRPIFAKGADLIIEDSNLAKRSKERTAQMIKDCVAANFNCIRVWGGAYYPEDYFYELCDEYGIMLYHDFMFACGFYPSDQNFLDKVRKEVIDNVVRIRNHASLALFSGNNEIETGMEFWCGTKYLDLIEALGVSHLLFKPEEMESKKQDIIKLFYELIGGLVAEYAPQTSYIASSPINEEIGVEVASTGDSHYYLSYDEMRPYREITEKHFRFLSEVGFQSYPDYKTIEAFTEKEDKGPYTPVMLQYQKYVNGNQVLENYLAQDYEVPEDFRKYVYASQILDRDVVSYSIRHFRRETGYCMGYIAWQLNDCWPTVSWSCLDYFGRWKGQMYTFKNAFAPVIVSIAGKEKSIEVYVNNDRPKKAEVTVSWTLYYADGSILQSESVPVSAEPQSCVKAVVPALKDLVEAENEAQYYLIASAEENGEVLDEQLYLFYAVFWQELPSLFYIPVSDGLLQH